MSGIQLEPQHKKLIKEILTCYNVKAYVYGSRTRGTARTTSDLDLVIKTPLEKRLLRKIRAELEESRLPFKVDITSWNDLDPGFQSLVENDLIEF